MQCRPSFHQPSLPHGQLAGDEFHRLDSEYGHGILIIGMKVRGMVRLASLHKHSNDDPEKAAELRQLLL